MAEHMIQRACERFRKELLPQDAELIQSKISLDDVKIAIQQVERELAARQSLRNLQRLTPFVDAIDRYSKAIEVAANGTPYLPWLWAPLKIILQGTYDCTHALDRILIAYCQIGNNMPRLTRYINAFPQHQDFQRLVAFLFEDIMEFHRKAYSMICKPGWKIYFSSLWGLFEHRFDDLLQNIARTSELIDKEAVSLDITQAAEQRQRDLDASISRETRWKTEQLQSVLDWLEMGESDPELKLEWLHSRCYEGTSQWITKSSKLRSWLQRGRGPNLLWLYGKPGSGKSILSSQIIYFLRSDPARHVLFFFCDFHTPAMEVTAYIFKSLCSQLVRMSSEFVPFVYNDYVSKGRKVVPSTLKEILTQLLAHFEDVRLVLDGIDELPQGEHRTLIKTICEVTDSNPTCKTLIVSQDIPTIATSLSKKQRMCISEEENCIRRDMDMVVDGSLREINNMHEGFIEEPILQDLKGKILEKAKGMFLWVRLVLDLLESAISVQDLRLQLDSLPRDLVEVYEKILGNMRHRCSDGGVMQMRRVFSWLLCQRGKHPLRKHQIRLGMGIYPGCHVLTRETRPFPNATDICKPFIEDGPGGSLIFIHSTVPQFLLEQGQTPFMNLPDSQRIITFACVAQLSQALDLLSEGVTFSEQCLQLCLGICGLLPYANEHWTSHLAECGEVREQEQQRGHDELSQQLYAFYQKLKRFQNAESYDFSEERERWMAALNPFSEDQAFIRLPGRPQSDGKTTNEATRGIHVPTQILFKYHSMVQHILKQKSLPGVSQLDLISFKEDYGPTAFVCQVAGCERSLIGFPSESQLRDHAHRHSKSLKCYEKDCAYNDIGFTSERSLKSHKRKLHFTGERKVIPKRINTKSVPITTEAQPVEETAVSNDLTSNYYGTVYRASQTSRKNTEVSMEPELIPAGSRSPLPEGAQPEDSLFDIPINYLDHPIDTEYSLFGDSDIDPGEAQGFFNFTTDMGDNMVAAERNRGMSPPRSDFFPLFNGNPNHALAEQHPQIEGPGLISNSIAPAGVQDLQAPWSQFQEPPLSITKRGYERKTCQISEPTLSRGGGSTYKLQQGFYSWSLFQLLVRIAKCCWQPDIIATSLLYAIFLLFWCTFWNP
ncbi:hypothetical protein F5Y03DRAFT_377684 [Xylaria venustula]|nr:hypothetical protein F5Y03DRAFT_377684 [Xylaria venustula]